jgi:hypothetical protein
MASPSAHEATSAPAQERPIPAQEPKDAPRPQGRLWVFANSPFGLFLLSTLAVGMVSRLYSDHQQDLRDQAQKTVEMAKVASEIEYRIGHLEAVRRRLPDTPQAQVDTVSAIHIWRAVTGDREFQPGWPEYKGATLYGLLSRLKTHGEVVIPEAVFRSVLALELDQDDWRKSPQELSRQLEALVLFRSQLHHGRP